MLGGALASCGEQTVTGEYFWEVKDVLALLCSLLANLTLHPLYSWDYRSLHRVQEGTTHRMGVV